MSTHRNPSLEVSVARHASARARALSNDRANARAPASIALTLLVAAAVACLVCFSSSAGAQNRPAGAANVRTEQLADTGAPLQLGPNARAQINELIAEKSARTPAQHKIDSRVLLTIDSTRATPRRQTLKSLARPQVEADGRIIVDIDLADSSQINHVLGVLRQVNAQVQFASAQFKSIRARIQPQAVETIASLAAVRFIDSERLVAHNKNTTTQGDVVHKANLVRSSLGYTGNGIKVCVLSDGINSLAQRQATGDLPQIVDVLPGQAGNGDEGTAMLEILYDLVPEARLGFATSHGGEAAFAQNILDLADPAKGGCKVIVDDTEYYTESPFQEGIITQAVNTVTAAGVVYVSAATNSGNLDSSTSGTWEGDFNASGNLTSALIPGHTLHEFSPGVAGNPSQSEASWVMLYWAEANGAAATDYDLYVLDPSMSNVLASSTTTQDGTQSAWEIIVAPNGTSFPAGSRVVVAKNNGAPDRMISVQWFRGRLTYATAGAARGHSTAAAAISVAATPAAGAIGATPPNPLGPYPNAYTSSNKVEVFSSDGPRRIFFDASGQLLAGAPAGNFTASGGVVRSKPDLTAADGVATDTPGFGQFFGTSAAAPHAAAAAVLLLQAFPNWTVQQVKSALIASALDIHSAGWDRNSGAGIVMPLAALQANGTQASAALKLNNVVAAELRGNGNSVPDDNEDWKFDITLGNGGGTTATNVVATLTTSTPGVTITSGIASYGSVATNGSVTNPTTTPFRFTLSGIACGEALDFVLHVTSSQNSTPLLLPIRMATNPGAGTPQTFSYAGPAVAIPDGGMQVAGPMATANLTVSGMTGSIGKVVLRLDGVNGCAGNDPTYAGIDHEYVGDLVVGLQAPDGTVVKVINRMNGGFNDGRNFCDLTLDDGAANDTIGNAPGDVAPFTGAYRPDAPLAAFAGGNPNGTWQLQANDFVTNKTGSIRRFSLIVSPQTCGASAPPPQTSSPSAYTLDVDGNGHYDALNDGLLVLRYLLGLTGSQMTDGAIGAGAQRATAQQVTAYLDAMRPQLDIDGNGKTDGMTDGLLVLRYMFGARGAVLTQGAVGPGATRSGTQIEAYLEAFIR